MKNAWFILLFPSLVSAHPSHSEIGLVSGILHPFSGIDHMAAMMGVGLVCSLYFGRDRLMKWASLAVLTLSLILGATIAASGVFIATFDSLITLSVISVGLILTFGVSGRLVSQRLVYMLASLACFHGYIHLFEMPMNTSAMQYTIGFVIASALMYLVGFILGTQFENERSKRSAFLYSGSMYLAMTALFLV